MSVFQAMLSEPGFLSRSFSANQAVRSMWDPKNLELLRVYISGDYLDNMGGDCKISSSAADSAWETMRCWESGVSQE